MATFVCRARGVRCLVDACKGVLSVSLDGRVLRPRVALQAWARLRPANLPPRVWSAGQQRLLGAVQYRARVAGANEVQRQEASARYVHVSGLPGCG